jgi:putative flavoprotein involved in K+ transport
MTGSPRALVIGAGPAGLAAAACLQREGVPFRLVDRRGVAGGAFNLMYRGVTLMSPARYTSLPGLKLRVRGEYVTAPQYRDYLQRYVCLHRLNVERAEVERVERVRRGFRVTFMGDGEPCLFDAVVVATGMFDCPIRPSIEDLRAAEDSGAELEVMHARDWRGPENFRGRRLLIVGAASSGVELAEECARAGVAVTVSARSGIRVAAQRFLGRDVHDYAYRIFDRIPVWLLGSYCSRRPTLPGIDLGFRRFVREGLIVVRGLVTVIDGRRVKFADSHDAEFDAVVLATGYQFRTPFLPDSVARAAAGHPLSRNGESTSWEGLFVLGMPCARTVSSEFLYGIARDAPEVARQVRARLGRTSFDERRLS